jgi:undecaprenyl-diphosphatase
VTLTEAIILGGIVQGLTEPLPVSSSAHLVIIPALIPEFHQPSIFFDVILHVGTLVAVIFFLRKDIAGIFASLLPKAGFWSVLPALTGEERTANRRLVLWIVVATFLTDVIGILFKDRIERLFESVETTAVMLFIMGILLFLSDRVKKAKREKSSMNLMDGIVIGLVQAVALIPGISRSGATITFGIFRSML